MELAKRRLTSPLNETMLQTQTLQQLVAEQRETNTLLRDLRNLLVEQQR